MSSISLVLIHKRRFHRTDAKSAEKFLNENNQPLCALCGFAMNLFLIRMNTDYRIAILPRLVRKERLELSRVAPLAPKTSASTDSATFAVCTFPLGRHQQIRVIQAIITACRHGAHPGFFYPTLREIRQKKARASHRHTDLVGRVGIEPTTNGLRVHCSTN
jgi:hypothetical protein